MLSNILYTKNMKTKMGRPVLPKGEAKNIVICARFTASENREIEAAIKCEKISKPEWVRNSLISAAKRGTVAAS